MNTPERAVAIALSLVGHSVYELSTGDCDTPDDEPTDCAGLAICKCYGERRHCPPYNRGDWSTVEDDLNSNSIIEDARHRRQKFKLATGTPQLGDLIAYPTIRLRHHNPDGTLGDWYRRPDGSIMLWIGHVVIVVGVDRVLVWDWDRPDWSLLDIVQSCGPDGRRPGIIESTGAHFCHHDHDWPLEEHRSVLLRAVP